jgi:hypothetical protein
MFKSGLIHNSYKIIERTASSLGLMAAMTKRRRPRHFAEPTSQGAHSCKKYHNRAFSTSYASSKRCCRTLGGMIVLRARCLRIAACLPANLWPEIIQAAVYLNNRTPKRQLSWKTPYEALTQSKPNLSHLRIYGCRAYPLNKHIPRSEKL